MGLRKKQKRESLTMLLTYEEMREKTSRFYEGLQIKIPEQYVDLAVRSLTMPQYAKEYQDKYGDRVILLRS